MLGSAGHSRKRGKPSHSQQTHADVYGAVVGKPSTEMLRNSSTNAHKVELQLACGQHYRYMTLRAAVEAKRRLAAKSSTCVNHDSFKLYCKVCNMPEGQGRQASKLERACFGLLEQLYPGETVYLEVRVLKQGGPKQAAADFFLPGLRLAVMVDGKQHDPSQGQIQLNSSAQEQAARDAAYDAMVAAERDDYGYLKGLVRLHYADEGMAWAKCMESAAQHSKDESVKCFVVCSSSYRNKDKVVKW